jgi:SWI/SNF-related matrix-associated actin-dependent regulator of chromatin subfamily A3
MHLLLHPLSDVVFRSVAPLSVISNWEKQIDDHCVRGALSCYTYYGTKRDITPKELQKFDVVITTYQTVAGEHEIRDAAAPSKKKKKVEKTLFDIQWKVTHDHSLCGVILADLSSQRIVLDEAHTIRNPKTKMAKAACALVAQRRWALAATPIVRRRDLPNLMH